MTDDARALAPLYALLARLALVELDPPLIDALRRDDVLPVLDKVEPGCAEFLSRDWSPDDYERAATEYCALFILPNGPDGTSPRASSWLPGERETVGAGVDGLVGRVLSTLGIEPDGPLAKVPRDHLGFLLHLAALTLDDEREDVRAVGGGLIALAIRPWVGAWATRVRREASLPLYRAHASLVAQLVGGDP